MPVLATDLDGTFIPLDDRPSIQALETFRDARRRGQLDLVFVTGRHFESVLNAIGKENLPKPDFVICDVGGSLYQYQPDQESFAIVAEYHAELARRSGADSFSELRTRLADVTPGARLQETEKQGRFKISFYVDAKHVDTASEIIRNQLVAIDVAAETIVSVDPFNGDGLVDILPLGVSKAFAIHWWCEFTQTDVASVVFAGDSGNDYAALTGGFQSILVGNADRDLAHRISDFHAKNDGAGKLYLASGSSTRGVLQGCEHYGIL